MTETDDRGDLKIQALTVFLLKPTIKKFEQALDPDLKPTLITLKGGLGFNGVAYWVKGSNNPPRWKDFLLEGTDDTLDGLENRHQSVLVMIRTGRPARTFAFVFGYARSFLKPTSYVTDFGLKVVMNVVDPDKLRCVDSAILEEIPVQTRRQASRVSAMELFEVDKDSDMLRSLVGTPMETLPDGKKPRLGKVIAGSSNLALRLGIAFDELGDLCKDLLDFYQRDDYKRHGFDWVDHLRPVKDKDLIEKLDMALLGAIQAKDTSHVYLAPPEIIDWEDFDGIRFGAAKKATPVEFDIEELYQQRDDPTAWGLDDLRKKGLSIVSRTGGLDDKRFSLYRCLLFDHTLGTERYVLTNGAWYNIETSFAAKVTAFVGSLPVSGVTLADFDKAIDKSEGDYSTRICRGNPDFALMDRKNVKPTNARTPVEVCDIFTRALQFIHIKPFKASSTLSHLFSQGAVSADLFQVDQGYRAEAKKKVAMTNKSLAGLIPTRSGQIDMAPFEIVYAIIWKSHAGSGPWQTALPFFAQLNLMQTAQRMRLKSFNVTLKLIEIA
ncbi:MAG: TIGR04141 family sporadically distributed protein [Holophaga sp.]|nr:TIGR04141 family sporadically distributed protein [Holophaga sp.]